MLDTRPRQLAKKPGSICTEVDQFSVPAIDSIAVVAMILWGGGGIPLDTDCYEFINIPFKTSAMIL